MAGDSLAKLRLAPRVPSVELLALGGAGIGCIYGDVPHEQARATVAAALAAGIAAVDTAPWYGAGLSELRLGEFLAERSDVWLSTKAGRVVRPLAEVDSTKDRVERGYVGHFFTEGYHADIPVADYTASGVREAFRQSRLRLRRSVLDCLFLHDAEDEERFAEATQMGGVDAMLELRREGLVGELGLGMSSPEFALRFLRRYPAGTFDRLMLAGCWNLIDQDGLEVLQECQRLSVRVMNVGVFASGVLWGSPFYKYHEVPDAVQEKVARWKELADKFGVSLPQVALSFALLPEIVVRVAVGCRSPEELAANVALCGAAVPQALWAEAQALGLLPPELPLTAVAVSEAA